MNSKQSKSKMSAGAVFFHKNWWKIGISILLVSSLAFLGYNKYLDQQNVNNMKQLLAAFEKLEAAVEAETGEELYIQATCGSVGKFATSYACSLDIKPKNNSMSDNLITSFKNNEGLNEVDFIVCGLYSELGYLVNSTNENYYGCRSLLIRTSNESKAEEIFFKYDTSPGSSI